MDIFSTLVYQEGNDQDYLDSIESALEGADLEPQERAALESEADRVLTRILKNNKES